MAVDRRYLELHGRQWRVQVKVPEKVRDIIGRARLVRSLKTDSLTLANQRRWPIVAAFQAQIRNAQRLLAEGSSNGNPIVTEALEWRTSLQQTQRDNIVIEDDDGELLHDEAQIVRWAIDDRAEEISKSHSPGSAGLFYGIATGKSTPTAVLADEYLAEMNMKPRQQTDYRRAILKFDTWLLSLPVSGGVETVTRKIAGEYVSKKFVAQGGHWKTANKDISCLSSFWRWLEKRGHVSELVWRGQSVPKRHTPKSESKRPFNDDEIRTLLAGSPVPYLADAIRVAALSGMRAEEIARLKVGHIVDGCMEIHLAKTPAGERSVPIHPDLVGVIERRSTSKKPEDFLFEELPTPAAGSPVERSQKISKAFTTYRRKLGVDEVVPGARQSRIDFHSFRRWFIRKASDALLDGVQGFSPYTLAEVVGHSKEELPLGLTMGRYPGDASIGAKRACVEAVSLPSDVTRSKES